MSRLPAAVLWDMDGLLVDSEPVWTVAEIELAAHLGGTWSDELKGRIVGTRLDTAVPAILEWYGRPAGEAAVQRSMDWLLRRMTELYNESIQLRPGVTELLSELRAASVPIALVSSSYRALMDAVLVHGVGPFDLTIAGDEVAHAKPHPEPYLTACTRLGVEPAECVVLEDSPAGVASAEAAGCAVVAVPSVASVDLRPLPRRLVVRSLEEIALTDLARLVARP